MQLSYTHITHLLLRVWHLNKVLTRLWQQGLDWSGSSHTLATLWEKCCKTCAPLNTRSTSVYGASPATELSAVIPAEVWMSFPFYLCSCLFIGSFESVTSIFHHVKFWGVVVCSHLMLFFSSPTTNLINFCHLVSLPCGDAPNPIIFGHGLYWAKQWGEKMIKDMPLSPLSGRLRQGNGA